MAKLASTGWSSRFLDDSADNLSALNPDSNTFLSRFTDFIQKGGNQLHPTGIYDETATPLTKEQDGYYFTEEEYKKMLPDMTDYKPSFHVKERDLERWTPDDGPYYHQPDSPDLSPSEDTARDFMDNYKQGLLKKYG